MSDNASKLNMYGDYSNNLYLQIVRVITKKIKICLNNES